MSIEAMKMALEALDIIRASCSAGRMIHAANEAAIAEHILRQAIEQAEQQEETVMAEYKLQTYAAYKKDGEMKIGVVPEPEQEPVAWRWKERINGDFNSWVVTFSEPPPYAIEKQPLYTAPPQRQPLTDEQIQKMRYMIDWTAGWSYIDFCRAIESAHGITKGEV
jgi:hypothetical protein